MKAANATIDPFADAKPMDEDEPKKKGAVTDALVELARGEGCEFFYDDREDAYAAIPLADGGRENLRLKSEHFKNWLLNRYYEDSGKAAGRDAIENACRLLGAMARQSGKRHQLTERFAVEMDGKEISACWIDMGDPTWRAVCVTAKGWTVEAQPPLLFRRHEHMAALPKPVPGGRIAELFEYLNMKDEADRVGVLAWMVAVFFAHVPRPILAMQGVQGAAKTTSAKVLRALLDPSRTEVLGPPKEDQLLHQLAKHAVPVYDNLSLIPPWMADAFCRAVTGGASEKRTLYTDGDSVLIAFRRAMILTGINTPSDAPDLLSRTLRVELEAVPDGARREEGEFWASYNEARPRLFGALLDAVSATLRKLPTTHPAQLQRMADFTRIGAAAAEAIGYGQKVFLDAYGKAADKQTAEQLDTDPVATALIGFMRKRSGLEWQGKTGELFKELRPDDRSTDFPKNANVLGKRLNILRPSLTQAEIYVEPADLPNHTRGWTVRGAEGNAAGEKRATWPR